LAESENSYRNVKQESSAARKSFSGNSMLSHPGVECERINKNPNSKAFHKQEIVGQVHFTRCPNDPLKGLANATSKILGLANFSSDLEISTAFAKSLEVSFILHLFRCRSLACFGLGLGFSNRDLGGYRILPFVTTN